MCMNILRYHNITHDDMKNGTGLRVVLWVAGCAHHCRGCHNPQTWDPNGGLDYTPWEESELFEWLSKPWTEGITFSGGDPLHPANRDGIGELAAKVKRLYPEKNIWVYTGYELETPESAANRVEGEIEIPDDQKGKFLFFDRDNNFFELTWLNLVDILVDGRFDAKIREKNVAANALPHWRGSSNQRLIDVQASLAAGEIMERSDL